MVTTAFRSCEILRGCELIAFCAQVSEAMLAELAPGGSGWPRSARPANEVLEPFESVQNQRAVNYVNLYEQSTIL